MKLIVAVDKKWAIGYRGQLLVSIPSDQRFFRDETLGKTVVFGRKTLETFPGGRPLMSRNNIVLTRDSHFTCKDATIVHSIDELYETIKGIDTDDVYIIGGQSIYEQFIDCCDTAFVTKIDFDYSADRYFPNLDADEAWECVSESEEMTYYNLEYTFCKYVRRT